MRGSKTMGYERYDSLTPALSRWERGSRDFFNALLRRPEVPSRPGIVEILQTTAHKKTPDGTRRSHLARLQATRLCITGLRFPAP